MEFPLRMYYGDMVKMDRQRPLRPQESKGEYCPIAGLDELVSPISFLRKEFPSYKEIAGKDMQEIFGKEEFRRTFNVDLTTSESGYLKYKKDDFVFVPFEEKVQLAPIKTISRSVLRDSAKGITVLEGNYFGITPYQRAMGAFPGAVIQTVKC